MTSAALPAAQLLAVFDDGRDRHPLDRALLVLGAAAPEASWEELAALPVGRRDAKLLALRERLFGRALRFASRCSGCGERVEAEADTRVLRGPDGAAAQPVRQLRAGDLTVSYRLPDSRDLAAVLSLSGEAAASALLQRCVLSVARGEPAAALTSAELPEELMAQLDQALAEADPQAEIVFALRCPGCGRAWEELLDPAGFLWAELEVAALRLLGEVHALASAYGWGEREILEMNPARRRSYLDMVGA